MRLISRAELAQIAGVSKSAITQACDSGRLKAACHGDRVDLGHDLVAAYLAKRGKEVPPARPPAPAAAASRPARAPTPKPKRAPARLSAPPPSPPAEAKRGRGRPRAPTEDDEPDVGHMRPRYGVAEGSSEDLRDLTEVLLPLVERFGTDTRFADWLSSLKDIELIREKRLKNSETEGGLISRELVKNFVFGALEAANKRLLGDASKTIASKVVNSVRAKGTLEEAQRLVRDEISKQLKPIKATAARHLRHKSDGAA
jgi:hypothetical protein